MIVPGLVIAHRPLLDAFLGHLQRDMYFFVFAPLGGHDSQLHGVQCGSGVPARKIRKKVKSLRIDHGIVGSHSLFPVIDGPFDQRPDILRGKRLQLKDNGP